MNANVEIKVITEEIIEILKKKYYSEEYLKIMMERQYNKGIKDGQQIHVVQIEKCYNCS